MNFNIRSRQQAGQTILQFLPHLLGLRVFFPQSAHLVI
jgi:hypothetical protein